MENTFITYEKALSILEAHREDFPEESREIGDCIGHYLAEDLIADLDRALNGPEQPMAAMVDAPGMPVEQVEQFFKDVPAFERMMNSQSIVEIS